ncbi:MULTISPECIES: class F sortase [unclassified Agrococcus]|uniref:class F sortase n=1 Tax=unclassified Agrococcus TaxID=2615065 RepID=UPI003615DC51
MRIRTRRILVAALAVAAVALAAVGVARLAEPDGQPSTAATPSTAQPTTASPSPSASPAPSATPTPTVGRADAGIGAQPTATVDAPVEVRVADVGLDLAVVPVGVRGDGQMDVPELVSEVGWYRHGPAPGDDAGSAVLSAHVDSEIGPAPMAALFDAQPGSTVEVVTASGQTLAYRIETVEQLGKERLPLDALFARDGDHVLRLVTCAGAWDPVAQAYEDNLVVTAVPASP